MEDQMCQTDQSYLLLGSPPPPLPEACLAKAKIQTWKPRQVIEAESGGVDGLFVVLSGLVRLSRVLSIGERKTLFLVQPGHFFLEAYVFCESLVVSQAEAVVEAKTAYFRSSLVKTLIHDGSSFVDSLLYSLSCKALAAGTDVASAAYVDSDERLLHVLHCLADCNASRTEAGLVVNISQEDLGELVGMHRVSINRALKRLEQAGLLRRGRSRIIVLNRRDSLKK